MTIVSRYAAQSTRTPLDDGEAAEGLVPEQLVAEIAPTPERRLLFAVLDQALHDLRIARLAQGTGRRPWKAAAASGRGVEAWFESDDATWPCSFENVCAGLGLDADAIRERVLPTRVRRWNPPAAERLRRSA
jgi:hypothetical protein